MKFTLHVFLILLVITFAREGMSAPHKKWTPDEILSQRDECRGMYTRMQIAPKIIDSLCECSIKHVVKYFTYADRVTPIREIPQAVFKEIAECAEEVRSEI